MSASIDVTLSAFGQHVTGFRFPIGSTINWFLTCLDDQTRQALNLSGLELRASLCALDERRQPVQPPIFTRAATILSAPAGTIKIPWASGDTVPGGTPIPAGRYRFDVWRTETVSVDDVEREMQISVEVEFTAVATLPDAPVTALPEQVPLGQGPAGADGEPGPPGTPGSNSDIQPVGAQFAFGGSTGKYADAGHIHPFSATVNDGSYAHTLDMGTIGASVWAKILAANPTPYTDFFFTYESFPINPGMPNDNVLNYGHNMNSGGGPVDATKGTIGHSIESGFWTGTYFQQEMHAIWFPPNSIVGPLYKQTRFYSFAGHPEDGSTAAFYYATEISMGSGFDSGSPVSLTINPTTTTISSPSSKCLGIFDDENGFNVISLQIADSGVKAAMTMNHDGDIEISSSQIGRLIDLRNNGNASLLWNSGETRVLSPDNGSYITVQNGIIQMFSASNLFIQCNGSQVFIPDNVLYVKLDGIGTNTRGDQIASLLVRNNTSATGGAPRQFSPMEVQTSYGWTGSASRAVSFGRQVQPDGSGAGSLVWSYSNDEANYSTVFSLSSAGGPGFFGVSPPAQQTLGATPTGAEIRAVLVAYGLVAP